MKRFIREISYLLVIITLLPILGSCDKEDDVIRIFTGKTWKLTFIAREDSSKPHDFWNGNETARNKSMEALSKEGTFILNFEGTNLSGIAGGSFNSRAIQANISGSWNANGANNELHMSNVKISHNESDVLAKAFAGGLQNAYKYEGDENNLFIYYKEGNIVMRLNLRPQK